MIKIILGLVLIVALASFSFGIQPQPAYGGATLELDKQVYNWTDVVYITVVASAFNSDPNSIDTIDVSVSTSGHILSPYKLVETGPNTGIFTGKVTLDGIGNVSGITSGIGPTDGLIDTLANDNIQVSFEFTKGQTVTGSAIIRSPIQPSQTHAQPVVTVTTDRPSYNYGDNLTISGTVSNYISSTPISVIIRNPVGNVVALTQVDLGTDKTYSTTIMANTSLWLSTGTYEIDVQYGSQSISAKTTFQFSSSNDSHLQVHHVDNVHPHYYFYLEPFYNPYNAEIGAAMEQWHTANPDTVKFREVSNIYVNLDLYVILTGDCQSWYAGLYSARDHLIVICTEYNHHHFDRKTISEIALHEIGHALGFPHDNGTDIMNPKLMEFSYDNCQIDGYDVLYYNETCNGIKPNSQAGIFLNQISDSEITHDQNTLCASSNGLCINNYIQLAPLGDMSQWRDNVNNLLNGSNTK